MKQVLTFVRPSAGAFTTVTSNRAGLSLLLVEDQNGKPWPVALHLWDVGHRGESHKKRPKNAALRHLGCAKKTAFGGIQPDLGALRWDTESYSCTEHSSMVSFIATPALSDPTHAGKIDSNCPETINHHKSTFMKPKHLKFGTILAVLNYTATKNMLYKLNS